MYSRVLLNRIRAHVCDLVAPTQFGFVPGRQVHDAVDVWTAVQQLVEDGDLPPTVVAIMLDFAKAYDTLDRRFLRLALQRHGLPEELIHAVDTRHLATTAAYLADGQISWAQRVTTGIRQGCPLAPILFILAVHMLYDSVDTCPGLKGVELTAQVTIKLVGFADDTTAYLRSLAEEGILRDVLERFAAVSGLSVSLTKSKALSTARTGFHGGTAPEAFSPAAHDELFRYLGVLISSEPNQVEVWKTTIQQLTARLHLATIKTTNVLQRVQVCRAVIIPKITFVARHYWPARKHVEMLQRFIHRYVWFGTTSSDPTTKKAWMSMEAAQQALSEGGLEMPSVLTELYLLSARTVTHWMSARTPTSVAVAVILLGAPRDSTTLVHAPGRPAAVTLRLGVSLSRSGAAVISHALTKPFDEAEQNLTRTLRTRAGLGSSAEFQWDSSGWLLRDYSSYSASLDALHKHHDSTYGALNVHALLSTPIVGANLLVLHTGQHLTLHDLRGLHVSGAQVGDALEIKWSQGHSLSFRYRLANYRWTQQRLAAFASSAIYWWPTTQLSSSFVNRWMSFACSRRRPRSGASDAVAIPPSSPGTQAQQSPK